MNYCQLETINGQILVDVRKISQWNHQHKNNKMPFIVQLWVNSWWILFWVEHPWSDELLPGKNWHTPPFWHGSPVTQINGISQWSPVNSSSQTHFGFRLSESLLSTVQLPELLHSKSLQISIWQLSPMNPFWQSHVSWKPSVSSTLQYPPFKHCTLSHKFVSQRGPLKDSKHWQDTSCAPFPSKQDPPFFSRVL